MTTPYTWAIPHPQPGYSPIRVCIQTHREAALLYGHLADYRPRFPVQLRHNQAGTWAIWCAAKKAEDAVSALDLFIAHPCPGDSCQSPQCWGLAATLRRDGWERMEHLGYTRRHLYGPSRKEPEKGDIWEVTAPCGSIVGAASDNTIKDSETDMESHLRWHDACTVTECYRRQF